MNFGAGFSPGETAFFYFLLVWATVWRGLSLWRAAQNRQRNWFVALLVLNTLGILDIIYLFRFAKKRMTLDEIKHWFRNAFFTKSES